MSYIEPQAILEALSTLALNEIVRCVVQAGSGSDKMISFNQNFIMAHMGFAYGGLPWAMQSLKKAPPMGSVHQPKTYTW